MLPLINQMLDNFTLQHDNCLSILQKLLDSEWIKTVILTLFSEAVEIKYDEDCLGPNRKENLISQNRKGVILAMANALGNPASYNTRPLILSMTKHLREIIANNSSCIKY